MGGNVFKGVGPIDSSDITRAKEATQNLLLDLGFEQFAFVGSSMNDGPCGDLDVVVEVKDVTEGRAKLHLAALATLGSMNVKKVGSFICLKMNLQDHELGYQIDVMCCTSVKNATWLMRGLFRHMLLSLLAKDISEKTSSMGHDTKVTLAVPAGVQISVNGIIVFNRTSCPKEILRCLGLGVDANPSMVLDLGGLAVVVANERPEILDRYPEYIANLKDKKGYDEALRIVREAQLSLHM